MEFTGCKHLDFDDHYAAKKQVLGSGHVFWLRPTISADLPSMVQFCKLRGRINYPDGCTSAKKAHCGDYSEIKHDVDDSTIAT